MSASAPSGAGHPADAALVAYAEGTLTPAETDRVRVHLEGCDECRELARDLTDYAELEPPNAAYRVGEEELRAGLGDLRERLLDPAERERLEGELPVEVEFTPVADPPSPSPIPFPASTRPTSVTPGWLIAAAVVAIAGWSWGFYRHLETGRLESGLRHLEAQLTTAQSSLRQPRANVPVAVLLPADDPLRAPEAPGIPLGEAGATLAIELTEPVVEETYRAEVRNAGGAVVATVEGLRPRAGRVTLYLPPGSLEAGEHTVHLFGEGGEVKGAIYELAIAE